MRARSGIEALFEKAKGEGRGALLEHEAKRVLVEWGVDVPPSRLARSEEARARASRGFWSRRG